MPRDTEIGGPTNESHLERKTQPQKVFKDGSVLTSADCRANFSGNGTVMATSQGDFRIGGHVFGTLDPELPNHYLLLLRDKQGKFYLYDRGDRLTEEDGTVRQGETTRISNSHQGSIDRIIRGVETPKMITVEYHP